MTFKESVVVLEALVDNLLSCLIMIYGAAILFKVVKLFTTF